LKDFKVNCGEILKQYLTGNTTLTRLTLGSTYSSYLLKMDIKLLSESLKSNTTLSYLSISRVQVEIEDLPFLCKALEFNTTLSTLAIDCTTKESCSFLLKNKPNTVTIKGGRYFENYELSAKLAKDYQLESALKMIPEKMLKEGSSEGIDNYFKDYRDGREPWREMKVMVLGNGRIGKTTLVETIQCTGTPNNLNKDAIVSTVGVHIQKGNFSSADHISIWDFAGQLEYSVTHQFLLSESMALYIICFDLSKPLNKQKNQIEYWLNFLQSSLFPSGGQSSCSDWEIVLVGLRADELATENNQITYPYVSQHWPKLPFNKTIFRVCSLTKDGVVGLIETVKTSCNQILDNHGKEIPKSYKIVLNVAQEMASTRFVVSKDELVDQITKTNQSISKDGLVERALLFLHNIGEVITFKDRVCVQPIKIPQIMAKFVSPKEVRSALYLEENSAVGILPAEDIGVILQTGSEASSVSRNVREELEVMCHFGVCYRLCGKDQIDPLYLFPSLGVEREFVFYDDLNSLLPSTSRINFRYAGTRFQAPKEWIFVPSLFCKIMVEILSIFNIYRQDLIEVCANGMQIKCQGLLCGEIIVCVDASSKFVDIVMRSEQPDLEVIIKSIQRMMVQEFPKCLGCVTSLLCPSCVQSHYTSVPNRITKKEVCEFREQAIGGNNIFCCLRYHKTSYEELFARIPHNAKTHCRSHKQAIHHFFLNYRVGTEKEVTDVLYNTLACSRLKNGSQVDVFWDQKCLNYGQNWEAGFLHWLKNSKAIVLLISQKALNGIVERAPNGQDNVLVEYEAALIQNSLHSVSVFPVLLGEDEGVNAITSSSWSSWNPFNWYAWQNQQSTTHKPLKIPNADSMFPNLPHKRNKEVDGFLSEMSNGDPPEFLRSISATMSQIFKLQGLRLTKRGSDAPELSKLVQELLNLFER